jgi:hypothetical protein
MTWWKKKKKTFNELRMEFLERGRIDFMELENKRICIKQEKIELAKRKEERERMQEERQRMKEREGNYDNGIRDIASSATRIFSSSSIGNPCKKKNW